MRLAVSFAVSTVQVRSVVLRVCSRTLAHDRCLYRLPSVGFQRQADGSCPRRGAVAHWLQPILDISGCSRCQIEIFRLGRQCALCSSCRFMSVLVAAVCFVRVLPRIEGSRFRLCVYQVFLKGHGQRPLPTCIAAWFSGRVWSRFHIVPFLPKIDAASCWTLERSLLRAQDCFKWTCSARRAHRLLSTRTF